MPALESLILLALLAVELFYVGYIILLTIEEIINWFGRIRNKTPNDVGFTVAEALSSGRYKVVQGVFNKGTNRVTKGRKMDVGSLDSRLRNFHRSDKVVIYE